MGDWCNGNMTGPRPVDVGPIPTLPATQNSYNGNISGFQPEDMSSILIFR